jgi:hypothetical protein
MLKRGSDMKIIRFVFFFLILTVGTYSAFAVEAPKIPEPLKPWVDWVLHGHEEEYLCIPQHNNQKQIRCSWPTELSIMTNDRGGTFEQAWLIHYESWIPLPGSDRHWPEKVRVNNKPVVVIRKDNRPQIRLKKGNYKISGELHWNKLPEYLQIPRDSALLSLSINGRKTDFPNIDNQGKLWLQSQLKKEEKIENRLNIQSYRLIDDRIPPRIVLRLVIDVAGSAREVILGPPFSTENFIPVSLQSSLPARIEQDGAIRMQIRPGQWTLTYTVRHTGAITSITSRKHEDKYWPDEEIWVFNAHTNLRIVEIEGVPSIDPQQTSLPENWRTYPAYRVLTGDTMSFKEIKRGDPEPAPDRLTMQRNLWLRFDGSGYTVQDTIQGKKSSDWRFEMNPPIHLGRVAVDGVEQFITQREGTDKTGIELRQGNIKLKADSEYLGSLSTVPATGWDHDFQQVKTSLFLPPGYRILNVSGVDNVPNTWITRWTLLDLFVLLIFTIAVAKLFSNRLAVIAFITMGLLYHEPGAPQSIWLALLVGIALLRYLPAGRFRKIVKAVQILFIVVLIAIAIPFAIKELRVGIYPQLEKPWQSMAVSYPSKKAVPAAPMVEEKRLTESYDSAVEMGRGIVEDRGVKSLKQQSKSKSYYSMGRTRVAQYDPGMINQTGPGLPAWKWNTVYMTAGPVQRDQQISMLFIGPKVNFILSFLRVGMLILLACGILGIRYSKGSGWQLPDLKTFLVIPFIVFCLLVPFTGNAADIPTPDMFQELQKRLLEKDDCFPGCADVASMNIHITPNDLTIIMSVDSQIDAALSLPGNPKHWLPQEVSIDNRRADALYRTPSGLWVLLTSGKHEILLKGALPKYNTIQLPLPMKPHNVNISEKGWTSEGVYEDGSIDNQIQFQRITEDRSLKDQILDTGVLPQFALVERTLLLGLDWRIMTQVQRISPLGSAIVLSLPLVPGESVITEGLKVENGTAQINLDAQTRQIQWESVLDKADEIVLTHKETDQWTEIWQVDVSPIFHMEYEGIPVILHQTGNRWTPRWHPWPGEQVKLSMSRPSGIKGQTLTIDKSHLELRPGQRAEDAKLTLSIRSSQGGQHTIVLPEGAQLQEVTIGGRPQPIRQEGRDVPLPITPGKQEIALQWRVHEGLDMYFKTPSIDLGSPNANVHIDVHWPRNRWPLLLSGPQLGPAILFWSVVIVIILASFGLSKTGLTPLTFRHWFLLGIGMSQSTIVLSMLVAGWLIAVHFREKVKPDMEKRTFNLMQAGLAFLTVLALASLIAAISQGLLGHPDMNIVGNGSRSELLRWYQDYSSQTLPQAGVLSIPMFNYRLAMLAWALWISFSLISILKWAWKNYTHPVIWHSLPKKMKPGKKLNLMKKDSEEKTKE